MHWLLACHKMFTITTTITIRNKGLGKKAMLVLQRMAQYHVYAGERIT